jgi:hypothetical protein
MDYKIATQRTGVFLYFAEKRIDYSNDTHNTYTCSHNYVPT